MIRTIALDNPSAWKSCLKNHSKNDFYYSFDYHKLSIGANETAALLVFENEDVQIIFPIIKRPIESDLNKGYFDITSVYGYAGPITDTEISIEIAQLFQQELKSYFIDNKIVAVFSRFHPTYSVIQRKLFVNFGTIALIGKTVYIDLKESLEEQKRQYRKSNKSEINQLRKAGVSIKKATEPAEIEKFIAIYTANMKRVSAKDYYYFSAEYFQAFLDSADYESFVLLAYYEEKIIAGAIFTISGEIMQYHLAGTDDNHLKFTPMKLILDEARLMANELKLSILHLGGGLGANELDSLFLFKKGFSDKTYDFYIWEMIVNQEIYTKLVAEKEQEKELNQGFFPLYRA